MTSGRVATVITASPRRSRGRRWLIRATGRVSWEQVATGLVSWEQELVATHDFLATMWTCSMSPGRRTGYSWPPERNMLLLLLPDKPNPNQMIYRKPFVASFVSSHAPPHLTAGGVRGLASPARPASLR